MSADRSMGGTAPALRGGASHAGSAPSFVRGLLLALFAGLGALPWQVVFGTLWDYDTTLAVYQLSIAVLAAVVCAPSLRGAVGAGLLTAALCGPLALTLPGLATATLGVLCALGLARSALSYPRPFARALAFELLIALPAAAAFALFHDGYAIGNSLAVWAFWLVQSAFALLPASAVTSERSPRDRFEAATAAAEQLMQRRT